MVGIRHLFARDFPQVAHRDKLLQGGQTEIVAPFQQIVILSMPELALSEDLVLSHIS